MKFTVLVVVVFTIKEKRLISKKDKAASRAKTQPFNEYFNVRMRIIIRIMILVNNVLLVYDDFNKVE